MYDFDEAYAKVGKHAERQDYENRTMSFFAAAMALEIIEHFTEEEFETVSKTMMLVSGMMGGLVMKAPDVSSAVLANIIAVAGYDIKAGTLKSPDYGIDS